MALQQQQISLVTGFIDTRAPKFHDAFAVPSELDKSDMRYERPEILDLKDTLRCHQAAGKYVDFTKDLTKCTWDDVLKELRKAQAAAIESQNRGGNPPKDPWRKLESASSILSRGLSALPDDLCVLHGGLALVFTLARHSEMNRLKILEAFEKVPNIIEMARNKAETFPLERENVKSMQLHDNVHELHNTLIQTLPVLINRLVPGTFLNVANSHLRGLNIDALLEKVSLCAESVRVCAECLIEELIIGNYSASMTIKAQLDEILRQQRVMHMSIDAAHGKTHLLHFLMEQINFHPIGAIAGRDQTDTVSEMDTALPGYTPEDLLNIMNVNHLQVTNDAARVLRASPTLPELDTQRAAYSVTAPQVKKLLSGSPGPDIVAIDGHFDRTQGGKISALSYICAMLAEVLRQKSQAAPLVGTPLSPLVQQQHDVGPRNVVLGYFCASHTAEDDSLRGPQGLMRCLTMQLLLSLVANEWVGEEDAVNLPHLRDAEEELLARLDLGAVCRLFTALVRLVPRDAYIYCFVDGWSAFEREHLWQVDYETALNAFREATSDSGPDGGANFKLLITSPTASRWLGNFVEPGQVVSLHDRDSNRGGSWRGSVRGGLRGLARAATMSEANSGFGATLPVAEHGQDWQWDSHSRRTSA